MESAWAADSRWQGLWRMREAGRLASCLRLTGERDGGYVVGELKKVSGLRVATLFS